MSPLLKKSLKPPKALKSPRKHRNLRGVVEKGVGQRVEEMPLTNTSMMRLRSLKLTWKSPKMTPKSSISPLKPPKIAKVTEKDRKLIKERERGANEIH